MNAETAVDMSSNTNTEAVCSKKDNDAKSVIGLLLFYLWGASLVITLMLI